MKSFSQLVAEILTEDKYVEAGIDVSGLKDKQKHHDKEYSKLVKERSKHNKTSSEYRHISNDMTAHENARNTYQSAAFGIKHNSSPSYIKSKIKSAENHASKVSGKIPEVAKKPEKIKNIHDHVHSALTGDGFGHEQSTEKDTTHYTRRFTPYGDDRAINLKGSRTNTIHTYTKPGSKIDADKLKSSLEKDNLLGERGNHRISVNHKDNQIKVTHHITGKSVDDRKHNEFEYNYATGAHNDPPSWGTHYGAWKKRS